jgi:hypothetical protein
MSEEPIVSTPNCIKTQNCSLQYSTYATLLTHEALLGNRHLRKRDLEVSFIPHLVQEFIRNDKVVSQGLLLQLIEVVYKHFSELMQKKQHGCCIDILPRHYHEVQVGVLHIEVCDAIRVDDRCHFSRFLQLIQPVNAQKIILTRGSFLLNRKLLLTDSAHLLKPLEWPR